MYNLNYKYYILLPMKILGEIEILLLKSIILGMYYSYANKNLYCWYYDNILYLNWHL